jgi:hypothetical protein
LLKNTLEAFERDQESQAPRHVAAFLYDKPKSVKGAAESGGNIIKR